jgi:hypothetical protein
MTSLIHPSIINITTCRYAVTSEKPKTVIQILRNQPASPSSQCNVPRASKDRWIPDPCYGSLHIMTPAILPTHPCPPTSIQPEPIRYYGVPHPRSFHLIQNDYKWPTREPTPKAGLTLSYRRYLGTYLPMMKVGRYLILPLCSRYQPNLIRLYE